MTRTQFCLNWDSYKSSICGGFTDLQQNGEFVDMTLAADGHHVKVHKVLIALVSPYLKDLMATIPSQHPVVFLNNISYQTLCMLLEYIYTGEVLVRSDNLLEFANAAKSLHIKGLENLSYSDQNPNGNYFESGDPAETKDVKEICIQLPPQSLSDHSLPSSKKRVMLKVDGKNVKKAKREMSVPTSDNSMHSYEADEDSVHYEEIPIVNYEEINSMTGKRKKEKNPSNLQFTVSIRGSLQIILNRYIYNLNYSLKSGVRRWKCVDYRDYKCGAYVITKGDVVVNRVNPHNHEFHDKKILMKIENKSVFSALDEVEEYKEKERMASENQELKENDKQSILTNT